MPRYPKSHRRQRPRKEDSIGVQSRKKTKRKGLKEGSSYVTRGPRSIYVRRSKLVLTKMKALYERLQTIKNDLNIYQWRTFFSYLVDELWSRGELQVDADQVLGRNAHVPVYEDFLRSMPCAVCHKEPPAHGTPLMFFDDLGNPLFDEPKEVTRERGNSWNALPICKECWKDPAQRINLTRLAILYLQNAHLRLFFSLLFSRQSLPRSLVYNRGTTLREDDTTPPGDELVEISDVSRRKWLYDQLAPFDESEKVEGHTDDTTTDED